MLNIIESKTLMIIIVCQLFPGIHQEKITSPRPLNRGGPRGALVGTTNLIQRFLQE